MTDTIDITADPEIVIQPPNAEELSEKVQKYIDYLRKVIAELKKIK